MSWWIGVEIDTGAAEPVSPDDRNVTYNVGRMFTQALAIPPPRIHIGCSCRCQRPALVDEEEHERGLRALDGAPCTEAAGVISAALERMRNAPDQYRALNPVNGWGSYESAMADLSWLLAMCERHPKATVYIH